MKFIKAMGALFIELIMFIFIDIIGLLNKALFVFFSINM